MVPTRNILYAMDFSEASLPAFQVACPLCRNHGSQLLLLHVLAPPATVLEMRGELATVLADLKAKAPHSINTQPGHLPPRLLLRPAGLGDRADAIGRCRDNAHAALRSGGTPVRWRT
jgi:hypothetical protein